MNNVKDLQHLLSQIHPDEKRSGSEQEMHASDWNEEDIDGDLGDEDDDDDEQEDDDEEDDDPEMQETETELEDREHVRHHFKFGPFSKPLAYLHSHDLNPTPEEIEAASKELDKISQRQYSPEEESFIDQFAQTFADSINKGS